MSVPKQPKTANLVISLMYKDVEIFNKTLEILKKEFGQIEKQSEIFDFSYTKFYEEEFGDKLKKVYYMFGQIEKQDLADLKHMCFELEMKFSMQGKRMINIDCGYLTENSLVLASFKPRPHRIYLTKGVYADLQLVKENKEWKGFRWTFPDIQKIKKELFI